MKKWENWRRWISNGVLGGAAPLLVLLLVGLGSAAQCPSCGIGMLEFVDYPGFYQIYALAIVGGLVVGERKRNWLWSVAGGVFGGMLGSLLLPDFLDNTLSVIYELLNYAESELFDG